MIDDALSYVERDWAVFPCHTLAAGRCSCGRAGCATAKHPHTPRGLSDASTDPRRVTAWWTKHPNDNIGIAAGPSRLLVLDIDPRNGGDESLSDLLDSYGALPDTPTATTGGGGWHYYFAAPTGSTRGKLADGIDVKGAGGYVIAPPSCHATGNRYAWAAGRSPTDVPVAALPAWLAERIVIGTAQPVAKSIGKSGTDGTERTERTENMTSVLSVHTTHENKGFSTGVQRAIVESLPKAVGERNAALFHLARLLKALPEYAELPDGAPVLRAIVSSWHTAARPTIGTADFDITWADFRRGWRRVVYPAGTSPLVELATRSSAESVPEWALQYGAALRALVRLILVLDAQAKGGTWFLSWRTAAALIDVEYRDAGKLLGLLIADGYLDVVKSPNAKRATRYRLTAKARANAACDRAGSEDFAGAVDAVPETGA